MAGIVRPTVVLLVVAAVIVAPMWCCCLTVAAKQTPGTDQQMQAAVDECPLCASNPGSAAPRPSDSSHDRSSCQCPDSQLAAEAQTKTPLIQSLADGYAPCFDAAAHPSLPADADTAAEAILTDCSPPASDDADHSLLALHCLSLT